MDANTATVIIIVALIAGVTISSVARSFTERKPRTTTRKDQP